MAYVRKTDTLVTEMRDRVREMRNKAIAPYATGSIDTSSPVYSMVQDAVETYAWSDAPHLKNQMPEKWTTVIDSARCQFQDAEGKRISNVHVNFSTKVRIPAQSERYYTYEAKIKPEHCSDALKQWLADEGKRKEQHDAVDHQYNQIESQLMQYMAGQASLNSAIKDMPEIELYVPEKYLTKLHAPNEKREKKAQQLSLADEIGIDRDVFAAAAIAHRITSAHG